MVYANVHPHEEKMNFRIRTEVFYVSRALLKYGLGGKFKSVKY